MSEKNKISLIKFLLWIIGIFLIIFIGVNDIFALTYTNIGDKADITVVLVSTNYGSQPFNVPKNSGYNFNQVLEIDYQINNYNFEANKNYQLESHLAEQTLTNANYYTVQGLNGESCLISYDNTIFTGNYPRFAFQCPHATNNITISISNSSKQYLWTGDGIFNWQTALLKYSDTSLSGNTGSNDDIINNNNQNTQNIINNNTQNTEDIINNQNKNTEDIQNTINDNFNSCRDSINLLNPNNMASTYTSNGITFTNNGDGTFNVHGTATAGTTITLYPSSYINNIFKANDYIGLYSSKAYSGENYNISIRYYVDGSTRYVTPNNSPLLLPSTTTFVDGIKLWIPSGITIDEDNLKVMVYKNDVKQNVYEEYGEICTNKLDEQNETSKGILGKITDLFNNLFSNEDADISGLNNMVGWLPPGPVDSIINLPLSLFNSLLNTVTGTCKDVSLTLPFVNTTLVLPCFDSYMSQHLSNFSTLWTWIGITVSVFILYNYLLNLYAWIDNTLTMRENNLPGYYDDNMWGGM